MSGKLLTRVQDLPLSLQHLAELQPVVEQYRFRVPRSYLELIDWNDEDDPIRKLVVPQRMELEPVSGLDASSEGLHTKVPGLQHKFADTALLITTNTCAGYCRYCFRKRVFQPQNKEAPRDFDAAVAYIAGHPEVNNVILSGGDPLAMNHGRLRELMQRLAAVPHVRIIRLGSKSVAFDPLSITGSDTLRAAIGDATAAGKTVYVLTHFDHPRELTDSAVRAIAWLRSAGAACLNQCPLLAGVNTAEGCLSRLFEAVSFAGAPQYYVFQCRPTDGNRAFMLSLQEAYAIFERELSAGSGLARTARFCVAHKTGKIQVVAREGGRLLMRYLQAADARYDGAQFWQTGESHDAEPPPIR